MRVLRVFHFNPIQNRRNDRYPFLWNTMSEFSVLCVVDCPFCILWSYINGLKIETSQILEVHMVILGSYSVNDPSLFCATTLSDGNCLD